MSKIDRQKTYQVNAKNWNRYLVFHRENQVYHLASISHEARDYHDIMLIEKKNFVSDTQTHSILSHLRENTCNQFGIPHDFVEVHHENLQLMKQTNTG